MEIYAVPGMKLSTARPTLRGSPSDALREPADRQSWDDYSTGHAGILESAKTRAHLENVGGSRATRGAQAEEGAASAHPAGTRAGKA